MLKKWYLTISGAMFLVIAVLHLGRFVLKVPIQIGSWSVPTELSLGGFLLPLGLSLTALKLLGEGE
jgi:hypothetical protein